MAEVMNYSLLAGGKRLRPTLTLTAADAALGKENDHQRNLAIPAACAIEMVHTYSLIHDDLPSMDDDSLRRGRPTAHTVYGEGIAILSGDALLTDAFGILAKYPETDQPELMARKLRTMDLIAQAAGSTGMVGGQLIDIEATGQLTGSHPPSSSEATLDSTSIETMYAKKTGALIRAAAVSGAIMVGARDSVIAAVDTYAMHLGLAFQIVDDILDVEGTNVAIGKTSGKDCASGKPTYPAFFGVKKSRLLAKLSIDRAKHSLASAKVDGHLNSIADWVLLRAN